MNCPHGVLPNWCLPCLNAEVARLKDFGKYEAFNAGWVSALEEAAKVAEGYEPQCESCPRGVTNAIRHLAERDAKEDGE